MRLIIFQSAMREGFDFDPRSKTVARSRPLLNGWKDYAGVGGSLKIEINFGRISLNFAGPSQDFDCDGIYFLLYQYFDREPLILFVVFGLTGLDST